MKPLFPMREILTQAIEAVRRTIAVDFNITDGKPPFGDAVLELNTVTGPVRFVAEIRDTKRFATIGLMVERRARLGPDVQPLLVAPYITRALAQECRALELAFIDTAGNAYIKVPGLTLYATGEPRPALPKAERTNYRIYTEVGMKVVFALLCDPQLANATHREIGRVAQVAFGPVGAVIKELENRGHLVQRDKTRRLVNTRDLAEAWVTRYPDALRPKLLINRYQADPDRLQGLDLQPLNAIWGAEAAAQRLTGYLQPERFVLYLRGDINPLLTQARMRLDRNGNTELLKTFWDLPEDPAHPNLVPPLLVYADLMATQDGRNLETARLLYEQYLEPVYRT